MVDKVEMPTPELLKKPLPRPRRDWVGYAAAHVLEVLLELLLGLEFLARGYTRNAAGKVFQAWRALTAAILALHIDRVARAARSKEEKEWLLERAVARVPSTRLKALGQLVEEHVRIPYYGPLTDRALDLHDYQYHDPDLDAELSKYRGREEAARDIIYLAEKIMGLVEEHIRPVLEEKGAWTRDHEEALAELRDVLSKHLAS